MFIRSKSFHGRAVALAGCLMLSVAAQAAPTLDTTFSAVNVVSRQARVQITLSNPDVQPSQLTAALTDTLPAGLRVADTPRATSTCIGGQLTVQTAAVTLASGAQIPPAGACTFGFDVQAAAAGDYQNTLAAGALQTTTGSNAQAATATLALPVLAAPIGLSKRFEPSNIVPGAVSRLTITLTNGINAETATSANLVDDLPAGVVVATPSNASTDCFSGEVSTTSGSVTLASGAQLYRTCSFGVDVRAASAGSYTNLIPTGALQTPLGNSTAAAIAVLRVAAAGAQNGSFAHGPYYEEIALFGATAVNMVAGRAVFSDVLSGDFDIGFVLEPNGYNAVLWRENSGTIAVDEQGRAQILRIGDTVGPDRVFAAPNLASQRVLLGDELQQGSNAFVGVRFNCDGRLQHPVPGGYCYGYVHLLTLPNPFLATNGPSGVVESAFNGDGQPIVIARGVGIDPPALTVTPNKLDLKAVADGAAFAKLTLRNGNGSDPLTFTAGARQMREPGRPALLPALRAGAYGPVVAVGVQSASPWVAPDSLLDFVLDDGTLENAAAPGFVIPGFWSRSFGGVFLNQFAATGSLTIDSVSIYWPGASINGEPTNMVTGLPVKLAVYYDPSSSGNPANALRVTADEIVTIDVLDALQTYPLRARIPGPGDVYIGYVSQWANVRAGTVPFIAVGALDTTTLQQKSWLSYIDTQLYGEVADDRHLRNNNRTVTVDTFGQPGNFMIRATASAGGTGGLCSGPPIDWLSITPDGASVEGAASIEVNVRANPENLAPGRHYAEICLLTNDPDDPVFWVPVTLEVLPAGSPACATSDTVFCNGYEPPMPPTITAGVIDQTITLNGLWFNFTTGAFGSLDTLNPVEGKDTHFYFGFGDPSFAVDWFVDSLPPAVGASVGGVIAADGNYAILQPGDTIGPDSAFGNSVDNTMAAFVADGGQFYLGVRFYNETRQALNYGYLHLETSPGGKPIRLLDYAYDWDGRPIVIRTP